MPLTFTLQPLLSTTARSFNTNEHQRDRESGFTMETAARKSGRGSLEGLYRVIMRRNSVYVTFIIGGAFLGERAVDYGVRKLWEKNNVGKLYEDIPVLGQRQPEE